MAVLDDSEAQTRLSARELQYAKVGNLPRCCRWARRPCTPVCNERRLPCTAGARGLLSSGCIHDWTTTGWPWQDC